MAIIEIKLAGEAEIPAILDIIEETWEPTYREILSLEQVRFMQQEIYNLPSLQRQMATGQHFYLLFHENQAAGFAAYSLISGQTFKLNKIYVKPQFHGLGLGKILLNYIETEVKGKGGNILLLNVNRYNSAKTFYEKLGFSVVGEEDVPIGKYWMNDYILKKLL